MPKFKVGEEYWQTDKKCYAKYIKEDDDRIGGLIVTYRGDLNTYGIDCSLLIDTSHTMLTELGFEVEVDNTYFLHYFSIINYDCVLFDKRTKETRINIKRGTIAHTNALSQLMREQDKRKQQ